MEREQAEKLLAALIFDDLDASSKTELLAYLETDDELREQLADLRMAAKLTVDAVQHEPAPTLSPERLEKLAALSKGTGARRRIVTLRRLGAVAAVLLVALSFFGLQLQDARSPYPLTETAVPIYHKRPVSFQSAPASPVAKPTQGLRENEIDWIQDRELAGYEAYDSYYTAPIVKGLEDTDTSTPMAEDAFKDLNADDLQWRANTTDARSAHDYFRSNQTAITAHESLQQAIEGQSRAEVQYSYSDFLSAPDPAPDSSRPLRWEIAQEDLDAIQLGEVTSLESEVSRVTARSSSARENARGVEIADGRQTGQKDSKTIPDPLGREVRPGKDGDQAGTSFGIGLGLANQPTEVDKQREILDKFEATRVRGRKREAPAAAPVAGKPLSPTRAKKPTDETARYHRMAGVPSPSTPASVATWDEAEAKAPGLALKRKLKEERPELPTLREVEAEARNAPSAPGTPVPTGQGMMGGMGGGMYHGGQADGFLGGGMGGGMMGGMGGGTPGEGHGYGGGRMGGGMMGGAMMMGEQAAAKGMGDELALGYPQSGGVTDKSGRMKSLSKSSDKRQVELTHISGPIAQSLLNDQMQRYVTADPENRTVTITAPPALADRIEADLKNLDKRPQQVLLDARIVKMNKEDIQKLGVDWGWPKISAGAFLQDGYGEDGRKSENTPMDYGVQLGYSPDSVSSDALAKQLNQLIENEKAKVVANPQVIAQDRRPAEWRVVQEEYYMMSDNANTDDVTFSSKAGLVNVESGATVEITPYLTDGDEIALELETKFDDSNPSGGERDVPVGPRRSTRNEFIVKDGGTVAITGLQTSSKADDPKKTSGLSKVPLLGKLFRNVEHDPETQELVMFVIARKIPDLNQLNDRFEEREEQIITEDLAQEVSGEKKSDDPPAELAKNLEQTALTESPVSGPEAPGALSAGITLDTDGTDLPPAARFKALPVNPWVLTEQDAQSTFGLDVDTASYTLCRRYLRNGYRPPVGAVRMEEFVNSFDYDYPQQSERTFAVHAQGGASPLSGTGKNLTLLQVGVKARTWGRDQRKAAHLVLVVDASASMGQLDRLPLVQESLRLLVGQLADVDRVSLISCATEARLHLEAVAARERQQITEAIKAIQPAGSTHLVSGLQLAYATARRYFVSGCVNQVILCSDGVANVGQTNSEDILAAVAADRKQGIFLTAVGVGYGAYNDTLLADLAKQGDGRYIFLDSLAQAQHHFVDQFAATLHTVAKDARIQVSFNPARVRRYRLIGYERRDIADQDFRNDSVDAGEVGSGQCSTALYELELIDTTDPEASKDLGTVAVRYRDTESNRMEEITRSLPTTLIRKRSPQQDPRFFLAAGAAGFAEWLRASEHARDLDLAALREQVEQVRDTLSLDQNIRELAELMREAEFLPQAP